LRVVAGKYKGRRLISPDGTDVRPTSSKVKEAVFSMLTGYLEDAIVIDLFCGTGSLGIEALSRGAQRCYFCDILPSSIALLNENLTHIKVPPKDAIVLRGDFRRTARIAGEKIQVGADIVFADPPYSAGFEKEIMQTLAGCGIMKSGGLLLLEHAIERSPELNAEGFERIRVKRYGKTGICLFQKN
jgi:16S rRNA (guanine(966)-N(2))-methyltransferase RsmD